MKQKFYNKRHVFGLLLALFVAISLGVFFVHAGQAHAQATNTTGSDLAAGAGALKGVVAGLINSVVLILASIVNYLLYFVFFLIIKPLVVAMLAIHPYTDAFVNVIYPGWVVIRNICNILFIVALIAMGLGTLFRMENYHYRHLIVNLIIAALLVNFSLIIGQAVLGVADTVQAQFLPANSTVINNLGSTLMAGNILDALKQTFTGQNFAALGSFGYTIQLLVFVSLAIGAFGVFSAIAVFLLIRVVMLWILLMVSPIAYVAGILPNTSNLRKKWWDEFLKYAFFTPLMAFFLNLAGLISQTYQSQGIFKQVVNSTALATDSSFTTFIYSVGTNLVLLVFLVISLKVAESFSIMGASSITKIAEKGMWAPFNLSASGISAGMSKLNDLKTEQSLKRLQIQEGDSGLKKFGKIAAFSLLNPKTAAKGWQHQSEEKSQNVRKIAEGHAFDIMRRVAGGTVSEERQEAQDHQVAAYKKTNPYRSTDQIVEHFKEIDHSKRTSQLQKEIAFEATIEQAAENKDLNDLLMSNGYSADRNGYLLFLNNMVKEGKLSEDRAARMAEKLSSSAFSNQEFWYGWGGKNGKYVKVAGHKENLVDDKGNPIMDEHGHQKVKWVLDKDPVEGKNVYDNIAAKPKDEQEDAVKALSVDDKKKYDNYKLYVDMENQQFGKFQKKEPQDIARNMHHSAVAAMQPDGTRSLSDLGANIILESDDRLYNQADRANKEQVKAFCEAITKDYQGAKNKVAEQYAAKMRKQGLDIQGSSKEAQDEAEKQIKNFSKQYLRYDIQTQTNLPKTVKEPGEQLKNNPVIRKEFQQLSKDEKEKVVEHYNIALDDIANYKHQIDVKISNPTIATTIQHQATLKVAKDFADNFRPGDEKIDLAAKIPGYAQNGLSVSDWNRIKGQIQTKLASIIEKDPTYTLSNLKQNLINETANTLKGEAIFQRITDDKQRDNVTLDIAKAMLGTLADPSPKTTAPTP